MNKVETIVRAAGIGGVAIGFVIGAGSALESAEQLLNRIGKNLEFTTAGLQGKHISINEYGQAKVIDQPVVKRVEFISGVDNPFNKGQIPVRRVSKVDDNPANFSMMEVRDIKARYGEYVVGGKYPRSVGSERHYGNITLGYGGDRIEVGAWIKLIDQQSRAISPYGVLLKEGEQPYYIAANFVNVIEELSDGSIGYKDYNRDLLWGPSLKDREGNIRVVNIPTTK